MLRRIFEPETGKRGKKILIKYNNFYSRQILLSYRIKRDELACTAKKRKTKTYFSCKAGGKRSIRRQGVEEDNIKMYL